MIWIDCLKHCTVGDMKMEIMGFKINEEALKAGKWLMIPFSIHDMQIYPLDKEITILDIDEEYKRVPSALLPTLEYQYPFQTNEDVYWLLIMNKTCRIVYSDKPFAFLLDEEEKMDEFELDRLSMETILESLSALEML